MASVPANVLAWLNSPSGASSKAQAFCYAGSGGKSEGLVSPTGSGTNNGILVAAANSFTKKNAFGFNVPTFPTWPGGSSTVTTYPFIPLSHDYMILPNGSGGYNFFNYLNSSTTITSANLLSSSVSSVILSYIPAFMPIYPVPSVFPYPVAYIWPLDDDAYNASLCSTGQNPLPLASYNSDGTITAYTATSFPPGGTINPIPEPYRYDVLIGMAILFCFFILIIILIMLKANKRK